MKWLVIPALPFICLVLIVAVPCATLYFILSRIFDFIEFLFEFYRKEPVKKSSGASFPLEMLGKFLKPKTALAK